MRRLRYTEFGGTDRHGSIGEVIMWAVGNESVREEWGIGPEQKYP